MKKKVIRSIINIHQRWTLILSLESEQEQLIGTSGSKPRKYPSGFTQSHRPYPQQKGDNPVFNPSQTVLGQLFSKGNATADSLPALKRKKDPKEKGKARS